MKKSHRLVLYSRLLGLFSENQARIIALMVLIKPSLFYHVSKKVCDAFGNGSSSVRYESDFVPTVMNSSSTHDSRKQGRES